MSCKCKRTRSVLTTVWGVWCIHVQMVVNYWNLRLSLRYWHYNAYECPLTNDCRVGGEPVIYLNYSRFLAYDVASRHQTQFRLLFYLSILHDTWCDIWNGVIWFFLFFFFFKGNFTCLEVVFVLKRRLGYYMFHTYIPTCLIVVMSVSISFFTASNNFYGASFRPPDKNPQSHKTLQETL